jgi:hypothetical protein
VRFILFIFFFRVAVPAVAVLSIHKRLRPPVSTDCNGYNLDFMRCRASLLGLVPIGLLHSAGLRNLSLSLLREMPNVREQEWVLYVFSPMGVRSQAGL